MDIATWQKEVDSWISQHGIRYFNPMTNMAILTEEVGELARWMAREYGEQSYKDPEDALRAREAIADEMADVLWVLTCLANQCDIDLTEALTKNLDKKTRRDQQRHLRNPKLGP
jgi:NTP pyrophosphatase (non-canonical NTP hydrolase)